MLVTNICVAYFINIMFIVQEMNIITNHEITNSFIDVLDILFHVFFAFYVWSI